MKCLLAGLLLVAGGASAQGSMSFPGSGSMPCGSMGPYPSGSYYPGSGSLPPPGSGSWGPPPSGSMPPPGSGSWGPPPEYAEEDLTEINELGNRFKPNYRRRHRGSRHHYMPSGSSYLPPYSGSGSLPPLPPCSGSGMPPNSGSWVPPPGASSNSFSFGPNPNSGSFPSGSGPPPPPPWTPSPPFTPRPPTPAPPPAPTTCGGYTSQGCAICLDRLPGCGWCNGACRPGTSSGPTTSGACGKKSWDWLPSQCPLEHTLRKF